MRNNLFIMRLPAVLFMVCMLPFFSMSLAIFGIQPEFIHTIDFVLIVFTGFKLAACFAALALFAAFFED